MADEVTLTEDLYDRRDPQRPAIFIAGKGAKIPRELAERFGIKVDKAATKVRSTEALEDKAIKPASTAKRSKKD